MFLGVITHNPMANAQNIIVISRGKFYTLYWTHCAESKFVVFIPPR